MKNIITYLWLLAISVCFFSCKDMDHTYKDFIIPNGITYPGAAKDPIVCPGNNRVKLVWLRGNDPKVVRATVYWNNYTNSVTNIPVNTDTISCIIEPLPENNYTFVIKTYDTENNESISVEVSGQSYGNMYLLGLINREVTSTFSEEDTWEIVLGTLGANSGAIFTELQYQASAGNTKTVKIIPSETGLSIADHAGSGTLYKYRTAYLPNPLSIDTFYTSYTEATIPTLPAKIDTRKWLSKASSIATTASGYGTQGTNGAPDKTIDGDLATFWHSQHRMDNANYNPDYPHWLVYDMGRLNDIVKVMLAHRSAYPEQTFTGFTIKGSSDPADWERLPDYAAWRNMSNADRTAFLNAWGTDISGPKTMQSVGLLKQEFPIDANSSARYVMIYIHTPGTSVHANLAEFEAYRY